MGTSKGYQAPTDPQWRKLKGNVTRTARDGAVPADRARNILKDFIATNGGSRNMARGGGTIGGSRAAQSAGRQLASFATTVADRGLDEALREFGLGKLIGKPASEIALSLVDELCSDGSTLDEVDARRAMSDLIKELLEDTDSYNEVAEKLSERLQPEGLGNLLLRFFGHYLFHQFYRIFYERLVQKRGQQKAESYITSIRRFIQSELRHKLYGRDLTSVEWTGQEGETIAAEIHERTLQVFGG